MSDTINFEELADLWPEVKYLCTACGQEGAIGFDPEAITEEQALNFFPCECGVEGKKIKIIAHSGREAS